MDYRFYGADTPALIPVNPIYAKCGDQRRLYDILSEIWSEKTCTPRLRYRWNENNKTVGQCAITAFIVQDIYGGEVYGIPLGDNHFHCFNKVGDVVFDLTSEQFEGEELDYDSALPQSRTIHFEKNEKFLRYLHLEKKLRERINAPVES